MQVSQQSRDLKSYKIMFGYCCIDRDGNIITEKGCKHLSKATWHQISQINLCTDYFIQSKQQHRGQGVLVDIQSSLAEAFLDNVEFKCPNAVDCGVSEEGCRGIAKSMN